MITYTYTQTDYGTERTLTVKRGDGQIIGQCDPFHNTGIPVDPERRDKMIREAAMRIARPHQRKASEVG